MTQHGRDKSDAYGWQTDGCRLAWPVRGPGGWGSRRQVRPGTAALAASSWCYSERTRDEESATTRGRTSLHTATRKAESVSHKGSTVNV